MIRNRLQIGALVLFCLIPVFFQETARADVLAPKVWTRNHIPIIMKGSLLPDLNSQSISILYVWAYRDNTWQQVVFQVDEMENDYNSTWSGYTPNPFWNYFHWDDIDNGPDPIMGDGNLSAQDELVFMSEELGDRVSTDMWPAGVPTSYNRYELHFVDSQHTGSDGWAYVFQDNTAPVWTTTDYVNWVDSGKTIDAWGYSLSSIEASGDPAPKWEHCYTYDDMTISSANGGDGTDLWDVQKQTARVYSLATMCQNASAVQSYFQDANSYRPDYVWGIKDGPVRVIRQYRVRGYLMGSQWGYHPYFTSRSYKYTTSLQERFYINSGGAWNWAEASYDHNAAACPLTYRDQLGNTATINGSSSDDSVTVGSSIPDWVLVTSSHGSYHTVLDIDNIVASSKSNVWNDAGSGASEVASCQTANGRYGDFGYHWTSPDTHQYTFINFHYTFLPDDTADTSSNGEYLYHAVTTPIPNPTVISQAYVPPTPTDTPTMTPTEEPTSTPTEEPTSTPTDVPTDTPTPAPTDTPTLPPTETPTPEPTDTPTMTPTEEPTSTPTDVPTDTPEPTDTPTAGPTATPLPVPASGPMSTGLLLIGVSAILLGISRRISRRRG